MAKFVVERLKSGYVDMTINEYLVITDIICDERDEVLVLPSFYEGEAITRIGFCQGFTPEHEEWADWHHPAKGLTWVLDHYFILSKKIVLPDTVKKVVIPSTIDGISSEMKEAFEAITCEIDPENKFYKMEDGKIVWYKKASWLD